MPTPCATETSVPPGARACAPGPARRLAPVARVLLPFLGLGIYGLAAVLLTPPMFQWVFVSEYGPVELGTAACFAAAGGLAVGLAARTRGAVPARARILYLLVALGSLFAGLEEISYGQHFFAWQSPRWFVERNAQQETNLHNLFGDRPAKALRNLALATVALGAIVVPGVAMRVCGAYERGRWPHYVLPRGELAPLAVAILLMRLFRVLPGRVRAGWDLGLFEVMELYVAVAAVVYVVVLRRRLLGADAPGGPS